MSAKRFFYTESLSFEADHIDGQTPLPDNNKDNGDDEENDDDSEFMQDVAYSSSSADRSSIGSIPWADDAIKQNQLDWELVERMLCGEEALPAEPELRNEIQEWQRKFPQLLGSKQNLKTIQQESFDSSRTDARLDESLELDLISNLSLNSEDEDDDATPTALTLPEHPPTPTNQMHTVADLANMVQRDLRISALPLRQRYERITPLQTSVEQVQRSTPTLPQKRATTDKSLLIAPSSPSSNDASNSLHSKPRLRMPPILNVLETKRRFRNLTSNQSFVQLTQVQTQPKSAAISYIPTDHTSLKEPLPKQRATVAPVPPTRQFSSAWHRPLVAARISHNFFNNRNAIILPAINLQGISEQQTHSSTSNGITTATHARSISNSSFGTSSGSSVVVGKRHQPHSYASRWHANANGMTTSTSTATLSTGRSVSAAVLQPRLPFGTIYVPYSASKFKGFK